MKLDLSSRAAGLIPVIAQRLDALIAWATHLSARQALIVSGISIAIVGFIDFLTGPGMWFGPFYLLLICLPTWTIGWRAGCAMGFACMGLSIMVNGDAYPLGGAAIAWNFAMRILSVAMILVLISGMRRSYDREWRRARRDALTGALNRQAFHEHAAANHDPEGWGILAYVDLDGFKQINDRHGHAAGDETLRAFAKEVRTAIRTGDIFARVGGDEFLLFLPVGSETEGYRVARQLHERMNEILGHMDHPLRCSMGVLILDPRPASFVDADVHLADQLMYQAKREGAALRAATMTALCNHEGFIAFSEDVDDRMATGLALVR
ncbi:GGDEF domain-containing protein [Sphingosinicella rhizophila]|uniref:diguanylate cyclase n=1 Tax=Sphingosinicella rhizophila TaxID=3050082 RepID=A0ABU3Q7C5_9SPHN|nr:GGDEF domain-containing protein [Sphingosinicella sp. GR2756]MDT9599315.1 GGDEF domain-containing protein [Sphingosinicella sp. GR2756]